MDVQDILNKTVSFQPTAYGSLSQYLTIQEVLEEIKIEKYSTQISLLRNLIRNGEIEKYNIYKKNLPGVTFSATFSGKRRKDNLLKYTGLLVIDIDKLNSEELVKAKASLLKDDYVFTFWESPSQSGLKGLVFIDYLQEVAKTQIDSHHKYAFKKLSEHFKKNYELNLDESGSDTTRLCFLSSDSNLILKEVISSFIVNVIENNIEKAAKTTGVLKKPKPVRIADALLNPSGKNRSIDRKTMTSIIRYLKKRQLSITENYENWYRVAYSIANTFTHNIGEKYFLELCKLDGNKYDETNSKNILSYCYENSEGSVNFNTIIFFANKKGYYTKNQRGGSTEDGLVTESRKFQPE